MIMRWSTEWLSGNGVIGWWHGGSMNDGRTFQVKCRFDMDVELTSSMGGS